MSEHLAGYDGSKQRRGAVKEFFNSIWYCTNHTMPNNIFFPCDEKLRLSKKQQNRNVKKTVTYDSGYYAICRKHPKLRKILERRKIGDEMAKLESDIMVRILLLPKAEGVTTLPIHDGLMVPASRAEEARAVMAQVSQEKLGFAIPVASEMAASRAVYSNDRFKFGSQRIPVSSRGNRCPEKNLLLKYDQIKSTSAFHFVWLG